MVNSFIISNVYPLRQLFSTILCYSQADFQPSATHKFMMDWALSHFVFGRPKLDGFIREHASLGAHTDIIEFQPGETTIFRWSHPGARPVGFHISKQCPACGRLKTRKPMPNEDGTSVIFKCRVCRNRTIYTLPDGWNWTHGPAVMGDQGQGAWMHYTE